MSVRSWSSGVGRTVRSVGTEVVGNLAAEVKGPPRGQDRDSLSRSRQGTGKVPLNGQWGMSLARLLRAHGI